MKLNGSILICGGNKNERLQEINNILEEHDIKIENNPDVLSIKLAEEKKSIGIGTVKDTIKALGQKPFSHKYKLLVVWDADLMTIEAQNTLLKVLDEPPTYATIILCAPTKTSVLPTILSRCKRVELRTKTHEINDETSKTKENPFKLNLGERLTWAAETSKEDREVVIEIIEDLILSIEKLLKNKTTSQDAKILTMLSEIRNDLLKTNVNLKLALEYLVLSI